MDADRSTDVQERTLKKYSDDILRVLEALNHRVGSLEESHERLAGTVTDLCNAIVDLKDTNLAVSRTIVDRADAFQSTLETAAGNVQILRDKQVQVLALLPDSSVSSVPDGLDCPIDFLVPASSESWHRAKRPLHPAIIPQTLIEEQQSLTETTLREAQTELARIKVHLSVATAALFGRRTPHVGHHQWPRMHSQSRQPTRLSCAPCDDRTLRGASRSRW